MGDKLNLNNIAKNNIKEKKYSDLRDQIASGNDKSVKGNKKDGEAKQPKRRTKEERITSAAHNNDFANSLIKKQTKINYSVNINLSPKRNDLDKQMSNLALPAEQQSSKKSPTRQSILERSRIKPYQKNSDIT